MIRSITTILLALPLVAFTGCSGDDTTSGGGTDSATGTAGTGSATGTAGTGSSSGSSSSSSTGSSSGSSSSSSTSGTTGTDTGTGGSDTGTGGASSGGASTGPGTTGGAMCDPGMDDCSSCLAMHCCDQVMACEADEDCTCFFECNGPPQQCAAMCGILNPGQNEAIAGLVECTSMNCDMVCN